MSDKFKTRTGMTPGVQKGTVPFSLRENRDSPQVASLRVLSRRKFLAGALTAPCLLHQTVLADQPRQRPPQPDRTVDLHIHLFGVGDHQSGCRISKQIKQSPLFGFLLNKLAVERRAETIDEGYVLALAETLQESGIDKGVILAQDAVYDRKGKPDWQRTSCYVPNDYLFQVVGRYPQQMVPCVSINPDRADALDELQRCIDRGARLLKIHPPIQGVDVADRRHTAFFRRCAEAKIVVMVHTGHEHSAPVLDVELASPRKLQLALEEGCTMVACHCGTGWAGDKPDMLPEFLEMLPKYPNLWGDTAVLGSMARVRDMLRLLADDAAKARLLHGSDFPFLCYPLAFAPRIGLKSALRLQGVKNPIGRDFALKDALGIGRESAERAYRLLI